MPSTPSRPTHLRGTDMKRRDTDAIGAVLRAVASLAMVAILGACQASTAGASHAPAASGTASSGATGSPTIAPSTCVAPQTPGDRPQPGNLLGKLDRGRILFGIEGAGGTASGTFAYAVI